MIKQILVDMTKDDKNFFEILQDKINEIRETIKGMSFDKAANRLGGYNCDGELFDYDYPIDSEIYLVGTVENKDGQPEMDKESSLYEVWHASDMLNARQILSMTEQEIAEQVDRLQ